MKIRRTLLSAAAAATMAGFIHLPAAAQQVIKLTATAGHPPVFLWVKTMDEVFIPEVDKRLAAGGNKYKIEWTKAWGGTLIKLGSESKGVADGIADIGLVSTIFEAAKFPMQNVTYFTPFGSDDVAVVSKTISEMQTKIPAMADAWNKNGLTYLNGMALDSYHVWTKFPITKIEDLQGKKLSAPGPAANWVKGTGAVAVAGTLNSYYEDIKSGVSDGAVVFATGAAAAKLVEVAPYVTKVNFGSQFSGGIAVNKSRYREAAARSAAGDAGGGRRMVCAIREDANRVGQQRVAEHDQGRRQDQRTQPCRAQALGRRPRPGGPDLERRRDRQGWPRQGRAQDVYRRTQAQRRAVATRLDR